MEMKSHHERLFCLKNAVVTRKYVLRSNFITNCPIRQRLGHYGMPRSFLRGWLQWEGVGGNLYRGAGGWGAGPGDGEGPHCVQGPPQAGARRGLTWGLGHQPLLPAAVQRGPVGQETMPTHAEAWVRASTAAALGTPGASALPPHSGH